MEYPPNKKKKKTEKETNKSYTWEKDGHSFFVCVCVRVYEGDTHFCERIRTRFVVYSTADVDVDTHTRKERHSIYIHI